MKLDAIRKNNKPQMTSSVTVDSFKQCSIPAPQRARCDRRKTMVRTVKFFAVAAFLFFLTATAFSTPLTLNWTDNVTHWTDWGNSDENGTDVIGEPQITGGTAVINNGYLTQVTFSYASWSHSNMYPGDLFLDTNSDNTWDYVVSLYNGNSNTDDYNPPTKTTSSKYSPTTTFTNVNSVYSSTAPIYSISLLENGPASTSSPTPSFGYLVTGADNTGYWSGFYIRNNQPFAVTGLTSAPLSTAADVSYVVGTNPGSLIFNIPSGFVPFSGSVTIGFATNCANDVVYSTTSTVPEPSTTVLLGSGLIMVIGLLRRKMF
jgi:hypothetical protein